MFNVGLSSALWSLSCSWSNRRHVVIVVVVVATVVVSWSRSSSLPSPYGHRGRRRVIVASLYPSSSSLLLLPHIHMAAVVVVITELLRSQRSGCRGSSPRSRCHYNGPSSLPVFSSSLLPNRPKSQVTGSVRKSSPMNRKKTGTGPDCNRLQPDLRLRFIRPEKITGCGSSKSGNWVNRHRAGWDRSQPPQGQHFDNGDTSTTATSTIDNHDDQPQQQHVDNYDDDTLTPATSTRRHPQHQHDDTRNINTTTPATSSHQQPQRRPQQQRIDNHVGLWPVATDPRRAGLDRDNRSFENPATGWDRLLSLPVADDGLVSGVETGIRSGRRGGIDEVDELVVMDEGLIEVVFDVDELDEELEIEDEDDELEAIKLESEETCGEGVGEGEGLGKRCGGSTPDRTIRGRVGTITVGIASGRGIIVICVGVGSVSHIRRRLLNPHPSPSRSANLQVRAMTPHSLSPLHRLFLQDRLATFTLVDPPCNRAQALRRARQEHQVLTLCATPSPPAAVFQEWFASEQLQQAAHAHRFFHIQSSGQSPLPTFIL
ncbi:hypothetical protein EDB85DRAFT_1899552 [Lactarius pseudohatsudake]|nr:hypothetical protein EDB85DRAFT_1899552 [Lactarius pseudohatsudake]